MHENYDDNEEDYDDHNYDDVPKDPYKWYYKFDVGSDNPVSKWLDDLINDFIKNPPSDYNIVSIPGFYAKEFPVNSYFSNTGKNKKSFQYLGNNYQNYQVWKNKYFIYDPIQRLYIDHIQANAIHFIKQPHYYKGLFDILN
jgi:hypothetical protein